MAQQHTPLAALASALREAEATVHRLTWPDIIAGPDLTAARATRDALQSAYDLMRRADEAHEMVSMLAQPDMLALPTADYLRACYAITRCVNAQCEVQS